MNERPHPQSEILKLLKGNVSDHVVTTSQKPGENGETKTIKYVQEGAGIVGIKDVEEMKEYEGLLNHILKTARVAVFLGNELKKRGENVDVDLLLNAVLISHAGRRQYNEAVWYPNAVDNAENKAALGDQALTAQILEQAKLPSDLIDVVESHGLGRPYPFERMDSWAKKLALYADYRVAQSVMSIGDRFDDLQKRSIDDLVKVGKKPRFPQELLDSLRKWAVNTEEDIFGILQRPPDHSESSEKGKEYEPLKPGDITDMFPPVPSWESYLRRSYINDAEEDIFLRLTELHEGIKSGKITQSQLDREFPPNTWFGMYAQEIYKSRAGKPLKSKGDRPNGIARAIDFFEKMEDIRNKTESNSKSAK